LLIYRNEGALPAAFVVPNGQVVQDEEARLALLSDPAFDPRDTVLLSESPPQAPQSDVDPSGPASREDPWVVRRGPNRIMISADLRQAGYLVLTETHYPGWRATVDGQRAEILAANHAFRAVRLEPGRHIVLFEYRPLSIYLGAGTTLVAGLLLVAAGIARWLRRREA
jgi:hypothetical protein